jgi:RHS repeat-associated protein
MMLVARADQEDAFNAICAAYLRASVGRAILQARYYDGSRGQFLSQDPVFLSVGSPGQLKQLTQLEQRELLADPQQLNSYSYGRGNPIKMSDPNGLLALKMGGQYTIPGWGLTGSAGVSFDQYGVDYYYGAGLALGGGGSGSVQLTTANLAHTYSISASVFGGAGALLGAEFSKGTTYYPYSLREPTPFNEIGVGIGAQLSLGGMSEVSGPLLVWGQRKAGPVSSLVFRT